MAITIDAQDNPTIINTGQKDSFATLISSGYTTGTIVYNIESLDGSEKITVGEGYDPNLYPQVIGSGKTRLDIILKGRTWYRVRVSQNGTWTGWTHFKTRDTRYQTPDAITQFTLDPVTGYSKHGKKTVVNAVNNARVTVSSGRTGGKKGATVVVDQFADNQVESVTYTSSGATIVSKDKTTY